MKNRLDWIDISKGILIVFVIWGHINYNSVFTTIINSFHMSGFFIITGFLFEHNKSYEKYTLKTFVIRKAKTIMIPYFSFSIIAIIYTLVYNLILGNSLKPVLVNIYETFSLVGIYALWFLPTLFLSEIVYFFIRKYNPLILSILISIMVLLSLFATFIPKTTYPIIVSGIILVANRVMLAIPIIYIGSILYIVFSKFQLIKEDNIFVNIFMFLLFMSMDIILCIVFKNPCQFANIVMGNPILFYFTNISGSLGIYFLSRILCYIPNYGLKFLGRNSLIIMATHTTLPFIDIGRYIITYISKYIHYNLLRDLYVLVLVILIEILTIIVVNKFFPFLIGNSYRKKGKTL